ncbi:MBG domain-containing protein [Novosphingobium sp.]|uniref:MBG domain-containing protein n=1 Tax=Novosphingobium sp. TaxID=1874826 RepID=UPI003D6CC7F7
MNRTFALALLASTALLPVTAQAQQLPSGGQVAAGSAAIGTAPGGVMTITQGTDRAVINWHDFSVGAGGRVDILQPNASSALLNRVTGGTSSTIAGQINANGQVFLVNPNGILITPTGSVKAAGFVASTLDLGDREFMSGQITVSGRGGSVTNQGTISIVKGGFAALIGGKVDNTGLILAPLGKVALGAGTRATLDLEGDGFLQVALPASDSGIAMSGRIVADGGAVVISAAQAVDAARSTVNLSGVIEARGFENEGGTVVLTGDAIHLTGASIDVSGTNGGGKVRIGGDWHGEGTLAHAQTLAVDAASSIKADATSAGNGGDVVLWSDQNTDFAGTISARGAGTGIGGNAEVSSAGLLKYAGLADLRGSRFGTLLLDPYNFVISNAAGSSMTPAELQSQLNLSDLSIGTTGDITIDAPVTWSNSMLTLWADNAIAINAPITIGGSGGLGLMAASTTVGGFSLLNLTFGNGAGISYTASPNSGQRLSISGEAYTLLYSMSDLAGLNNATGRYALATDLTASGTYSTAVIPTFGGTLEGLGHTISNLHIARTADYTALIGNLTNTGTIRDIALAGASISGGGYAGGLAGYNAGVIVNASVSGSITSTANNAGGLVGYNGAGLVTNVYAAGSVSGGQNVGGLVGWGQNGLVSNAYATSIVSGSSAVGGIVGNNYGSIMNTYATGPIVGSSGTGGLAGRNNGGSVQSSYWDIGTTGRTTSAGGGTGLTTALLQSGGASGLGSAFAGGANGLYPYLASFFPAGVQVISGTAYTASGTGAANAIVNLYSGGSLLAGGTLSTAANGYYYTILPVGMLVDGGSVGQTLTLSGASAVSGIDYRDGLALDAQGNLGGLSVHSGLMNLTTSQTRISDLGSMLQATMGALISLDPGISTTINTRGNFSFDTSFAAGSSTADLTVNTGGDLSIQAGASLMARDIVLNAGGNFINLAGASALGASGRWLVYLPDALDNSYGNLDSQNTPVWATAGGADVSASGNRYVFAENAGILTVSAPSTSKAYGDTLNASFPFGISGFREGVSGAYKNGFYDSNWTGTVVFTSDGFTDTANVGTYALTLSGLTGTNGYTLNFAAGTLIVTPRSLTVTADALSRIYGNANPALTYTVGGLVNGDTLTGALATSASATSNVGTYSITQGTLSADSNYAVTYIGANLTVTPRTITVTADAISRLYGNANPALTYTVGGDGLVNGDVLSGSLGVSATTTSGVGDYVITMGTLGNSSSNYFLSSFTGADLTVTPRSLTVTADALSRLYGNANPALTYTLGGDGLVGSDTLSGALATGATSTSNVGSYAIGQGNLAAGGNYTIAYTGADLTVTPRSLTVTAEALSRLYGNANQALTYMLGGDGLVGSDTLNGALATGAISTSNVGSYAIGQGTLAAGENYTIAYTGADLAVTPRGLTVTADALSRLYGNANPALTYTLGGDGLVGSDALNGALATGATSTSDVGSYAIGQGTLAAGGNYTIAYIGADLTVTPRSLTVTADAISRLYGNANPALTYTLGGDGLVGSDALNGALATGATANSNVGSYAIGQGTLSAGGNYTVAYTGADLAVTPRSLTVIVDAISRLYGNANPALTYTLGGDGLVGSDALNGALATGATANSNVGSYAIGQGTLAAGGNYSIAYTGADLTVTPRSLTVTADALSRLYGNANPALTYTLGGDGLVGSDALNGALATGATSTSNVGSYAIGEGTLAAGGNYTVAYTGADLTVTPRGLTVTADALTRLYGNANPALTYALGGDGLVGSDTLSGALATGATATSNVGSYAIGQGTLSAGGNYTVVFTGSDLTVTPRSLGSTAGSLLSYIFTPNLRPKTNQVTLAPANDRGSEEGAVLVSCQMQGGATCAGE